MMKRLCVCAMAGCLLILQGCRTDVKTPSQTSDEMEEYTLLQDDSNLGSYLGKKIILEGKLSDIPWQHLINIPETHPEISYLDTTGGGQTVLYSKKPIGCDGRVKIKGTVVEVQGKSKRPDSQEQYMEYQVIVDTWNCID